MSEDTDYNKLVKKNISEIKKELKKDSDIDLRDVLKAEKENKDRKTLKQWLEDRIEERDERYEKEEIEAAEDVGYDKDEVEEDAIDEFDFSEEESVWSLPVTNFVFGLVIGLAVAALFIYTQGGSLAMAGGAAISPQQAQDGVEQTFRSLIGSQVPENVTFDISSGTVNTDQYADLYMVPLTMSLAGQQQNRKVFVTKQSGLVFVQGFDLESGQPVPASSTPTSPSAGS